METMAFAARLRWWRERRGLSQLALANTAEVSQRHLSFLEVGRTAPSREMVLRLAATLDLPLRQQNALLLAAGFAPVWRESALGAPELAVVNRALDYMLAQQEPYPAFVVDRRWNLLRLNKGGERLVGFLTDTPPAPADPASPINLADAMRWPTAPRRRRRCSRACSPIPIRRASRKPRRWTRRRARCSPSTSPRRPRRCASSPRSPPSARRRT
jgi:transcriptional regulator with XRE-family HTH domain